MRRHKLTAVLLALVLALSLLPTSVLAAESDYRDTDGHWAEEAIDRWSDYGIIQGSDGLFNPDGALTRAHMAAILTRLLGLPAADSAGFADVQEGDWFADSINRCAAAGIMLGADGRANPNARITRQQAMVMLARALGIQPVEKADLSAYKDGGAVSAYARGYVAAMLQAGIVNGVSADTLGVGSQITRAATVTILDRAIVTYVHEPNTRVEAVSGGIVLAAADGVELTGRADTVLVAQGAGGGTVRLKGVTAEDLVVTAAHTTVVVDSRSAVRSILLTEQAVGSRVVVAEGAQVTTVTTQAPRSTVSVSGKVDDVITTESAQRAEVEVSKDGRVGEITAAGEKTEITVSGKVDTVTVEKTAEDTTVEAGSGASIGQVDTAAEGTTVSGSGKVESVTSSGDNTTVTTKGTEVEVEKGTTGTTAGGKDVAGGTTVTTPGGSTSGGSSSGGSSSGGSVHSHSYTYRDNGNGTHTGTCSCGATVGPEAHKVGDAGTCTVCGAGGFVARIGTTGYKNLQDALNVGGDVVLIRDVELDATKTSAEDRLTIRKPTTLTLNAKIIAPGELEPTANWAALYIAADTTINANANGGIQCNDKTAGGCGPYGMNIYNKAKVVINSGAYYGGGTAVQVQEGDLTINGGTFEVTPFGEPHGYKFVINANDDNFRNGIAKITVKGGKFYGFDPANARCENPVADFVPDGYSSVKDGENYKVLEGTYVSTEEQLNDQIKNGTASEIHLAGDIGLTGVLSVSRDVTLVGHGHTISKYPTYVGEENNVVFRDVKFTAPTSENNKASNLYANGLKGKLTLDGCAFSESQWDSVQVTPVAGAEVVINNCTFELNQAVPGGNSARFIHIEASTGNTDVKITLTNNHFGASTHIASSRNGALIDLDYINIDGINFGGNNTYTDTNGDIYVCGPDANRTITKEEAYQRLGTQA